MRAKVARYDNGLVMRAPWAIRIVDSPLKLVVGLLGEAYERGLRFLQDCRFWMPSDILIKARLARRGEQLRMEKSYQGVQLMRRFHVHNIGALMLPAIAASVPASASADVRADVLLKSDTAWNGQLYEHYASGRPEITVLKLTIPAHTTPPWHTHPMPNSSYILSGHLTIEDRASGKKKTIRAGEAFAEQVNTVHRGLTDEEPCVVVVTYAGTPGQPISVPVLGGQPEY